MHIDLYGIRMHVEEHGRGPALLLLHGFTGAGGDFRHLFGADGLERLGERWRVVVPDLRGHGGSTGWDAPFSHRQCAHDVLALLDALGIDRCCALGVSLGGNTLLHVATLAPARVEAMVVVGSPPYFPAQARAIMAGARDAARSEDEWRELRGKHVHGDAQIHGLDAIAAGFADSVDDMAFTPPQLARVRARTLIVNGDRDPLYPVELFVELYRAIPASALWILPGLGHAPVWGEARAAFVDGALAHLGA